MFATSIMVKLWEQFGMKAETFERWAEYLYHRSDLFNGVDHSDFSAAIRGGILPPEQAQLREAFDELLFNPQADPTGVLTRSARMFSESPPILEPQQSVQTDVDTLVAQLPLPKDVDKIAPVEIPYNVLRKTIQATMDIGIGSDAWIEIVKIAKLYPDTDLYLWPPKDSPLKINGSVPEHIKLPAGKPVVFGARGKQEVELLSHIASYVNTRSSTAASLDLSWADKVTYRNFDLNDTGDINRLVEMVTRETKDLGLRSMAGFIDLESRTLIIATTPYTFHRKIYDSLRSRPPHLAEIWTGFNEDGLTINIARINSGNRANLGNTEMFKTLAKSLSEWRGVESRAKWVRVNGDRIAITIPIKAIPINRVEFQLESMETTLPAEPDPQNSLTRELALILPRNLHLRPAAAIHKIVASYPETRMLIRWQDKVADATSVISMVAANIPQARVSFIAYGRNRHEVLASIKALLDEADPQIWGSSLATTTDRPPSKAQNARGQSTETSTVRHITLHNRFSLRLIVALMRVASLHTNEKLYIGKDEDHLVEVGPSILNLMTMSLGTGSTITLATGENSDVAKTLLENAIAIIKAGGDLADKKKSGGGGGTPSGTPPVSTPSSSSGGTPQGPSGSGALSASSMESSAGFTGFIEIPLGDPQVTGAQHMLEDGDGVCIDPTLSPNGSGQYYLVPGQLPMQSVAPTPATH